MKQVLNFSQFINESSKESSITRVINDIASRMTPDRGYVNVGKNNSIVYSDSWELDTMKISNLGRVEPVVNYSVVFVPKFAKGGEDIESLRKMGLANASQLIKGFTISSSVETNPIDGAGSFVYSDKSEPTYYSLTKDLPEVAAAFANDDMSSAADLLLTWCTELADEYGHELYNDVAEALEDYMHIQSQEEEDDDYEDEDDDYEDDDVSEKKRLNWHDSDAPDANGKFKELGVQKLADWLIRTRGGNMQKIVGSLNQQINFNKKKNPSYAKKMESTREAVKRKLEKRKDK